MQLHPGYASRQDLQWGFDAINQHLRSYRPQTDIKVVPDPEAKKFHYSVDRNGQVSLSEGYHDYQHNFFRWKNIEVPYSASYPEIEKLALEDYNKPEPEPITCDMRDAYARAVANSIPAPEHEPTTRYEKVMADVEARKLIIAELKKELGL